MQAITRFKLTDNRTVWFEPKSAIFPGNLAPIIRVAEDGERVLEEANWGFVRLPKGLAPDRVGNVRNDTILTNRFWTDSFRKRRCLVPFSSYCEPLGKKPASWWWHALKDEIEERPYGAFPGIWKDYIGPIKKNGENVSQRVFAFLTCGANGLESAQHHGRMPVLLDTDEQFDTWLHRSEEESLALAIPFPDDQMRIVQKGSARKDMLGEQSDMAN